MKGNYVDSDLISRKITTKKLKLQKEPSGTSIVEKNNNQNEKLTRWTQQ